MARALRILAAVIALIGFGWSQAHAQIPMTGAGRGAPGAAVAAVQAVDLGTANRCASGTSCNYTNLTITGALPNSAMAVVILNSDNGAGVSGLSATWDSGGTNQAMTQVTTFTSANFQQWIFGLIAPTSGNKTLALSWTGTASIYVCAISLKNVKQTSVATAFTGATSTTGTGPSAANSAVTSQTNDLVLSLWSTTSNWVSVGGTQICLQNGGTAFDIASSYDPGAATVTPTATLNAANNYAVTSADVVHN